MAEDQNKEVQKTSARLRQEAAEIKSSFIEINKQLEKFTDGSKIVGNNFNALNSTFKAITDISGKLVTDLNSSDKIQKKILENNQTQRELTKQVDNITKKRNSSLRKIEGIKKRIIKEDSKGTEKSEKTLANLKLQLLDEEKLEKLFNKQAENVSNLQDKSKQAGDTLDKMADSASKLSSAGGGFEGLAKIAEGVPLLKNFAKPFKDGATASREQVAANIKNNTQISTFGAGMKGFTSSIKGSIKTFGVMGIAVTAIVTLINLMVKAMVGADETATKLAKSLGTTKENARALRQEFIRIGEASSNLLVNSTSLAEAQGQLVDSFTASTIVSGELLENQVFLTKTLGLSAEQAGNLNLVFETFSGNAFNATTAVTKLNQNLAAANGFTIPAAKLFEEISDSGFEIQSYFGNSATALGKAVYQTRRFGLTLANAKNIAESLLDFETSIQNELELELLTGRQLNFERARALAVTGDIAGASALVLKQTQNLTEEQRKSPIFLQAAAKAAGLSTEELSKAFAIQKQLGISADQYNEYIKRGTALVGREKAQLMALRAGDRKDLEKNLTFQEKLQALQEKFVDQLSKLVDGGAIDGLVDGITAFVTAIGQGKSFFSFFGDDAFDAMADATAKSNQKRKNEESLTKHIQNRNSKLKLNDFTIQSHPKDTLVMAGGTRFGEETNKLLKDVLSEMKKSTVLNINSNGVVQKAIVTSYK